MITPITVAELQQHRSSDSARWVLVDVREPWEVELASVTGAINIPMNTLPERIEDVRTLQGDAALVLMCHHGMRSQRSAQFLAANGLSQLYNLTGGIDAWSVMVDPSVARY